MRYRTFSNTDLRVSEVGFGVWTLSTGWWGRKSDDEVVRMLHKALDLGITLYDTADTYGNGRGETLLAKAFKERRSQIVIATKFGYDIYSHPGERKGQRELPQNFSKKFVKFACEQSLKRLETDTIDLYQAHNARLEDIRNDGLFEALEELKAEGKIRYYGVALGPAIGWLVEGVAAIQERHLTEMQVIYNLFEQDPGRAFFAAARGKDTGFLIRVPHSSGLLEGRYTTETTFPRSDHRSHRPRSWLLNGLKKLETLRFLTEGRRWTIGQAALRFTLAEPSVASTLPNIYDQEQLVEFAGASEYPDLSSDDLKTLDELYARNFGVEEPPMQFKGLPATDPSARAILGSA
jgi:aryl-alcohol dehydrogenase-like predicted oxidoreductase